MIRIVNLRNYVKKDGEVLIKVDRSSILGNPYPMKDESCRDVVCDDYNTYFELKIKNKDSHPAFMSELRRIYVIALRHDVALGCWCYPKRCHAQTIKAFIEKHI